MIDLLTLKDINEKNPIKHFLLSKFSKSIFTEEKEKDHIQFRYINIMKKNQKIPWNKVNKLLQNSKSDILCADNISLPDELEEKKYEPILFKKILCQNAAIETLKKANISDTSLKVSLLDFDGSCYEFLKRLVPFSNQIRVITKNVAVYTSQAELLMEQFGVSILISDSLSWISPCNVIIAPNKITTHLPITSKCVVFTGSKNSVPVKGIVCNSYSLDTPDEYIDLIPNQIDNKSFLGLIMEKYNIEHLKFSIPNLCLSDGVAYTIDNISRYILRF